MVIIPAAALRKRHKAEVMMRVFFGERFVLSVKCNGEISLPPLEIGKLSTEFREGME